MEDTSRQNESGTTRLIIRIYDNNNNGLTPSSAGNFMCDFSWQKMVAYCTDMYAFCLTTK